MAPGADGQMARRINQARRTARMAELAEQIGGPISSLPCSATFVAQTLEVLPVGFRDGSLFWLKPLHAESPPVGLPASAKPADVGRDVLRWNPLTPVLAHSTPG